MTHHENTDTQPTSAANNEVVRDCEQEGEEIVFTQFESEADRAERIRNALACHSDD